MLSCREDGFVNLARERLRAADLLNKELKSHLLADAEVTVLRYPLLKAPEKVKSLNLGKTPEFTGELAGIRGQYLIFADGAVLNVRRHTGFELSITS